MLQQTNEEVKMQLREYFENPSRYFDVSEERLVFPIPEEKVDYASAAFNYYCQYNHLPVFSAVWCVDANGKFSFKGYGIISPSNINLVTEDMIRDNQKNIPNGEMLYIANYYLELEEVRCFKMTRHERNGFISPFLNTKK